MALWNAYKVDDDIVFVAKDGTEANTWNEQFHELFHASSNKYSLHKFLKANGFHLVTQIKEDKTEFWANW